MPRTILILDPPGEPLSSLGAAFRTAADEEFEIRHITKSNACAR